MPYSSIILNKYDHLAHWYGSALRAAASALVINALIFGLAVMAGIFESLQFRPVRGEALTVGPVLVASAVVPLFAFVTYLALERARNLSYTTFRNAAWLAIVISLVLPLSLVTTIAQTLVLQLTHVVVGVCTLYEIAQWAEATGRRSD
jgi:hypothetical protein